MAERRKSTMQAIQDPYGNARSHLPVPTTSKKPAGNSRMSLAGPAFRPPMQTPGASHIMNPRQSIAMGRSQNVNPLLMSVSKQAPMKTPLTASQRRTSHWAGAPSSSIPYGSQGSKSMPSSSQGIKDPRPLRDKEYQQRLKHEIYAYLREANFDIRPQTLSNISSRDFRAIVEFLVLNLDPCSQLNANSHFDEDFLEAMRMLKYPFAHQLDIKWLAAPATMHTWPSLLGLLHWLVEANILRASIFSSGHPVCQEVDNIPEEFDDPMDITALNFHYYEESYRGWLNWEDKAVNAAKVSLEDRYARRTQKIQAELDDLNAQRESLRAEYQKLLSSEPPLEKLQKEHELLVTDSEKFQKILHQYEARKKKLIDTIAYEKAELISGNNQLEQLKRDLDRLNGIVKEQNLTPDEVIRMNTDHATLSRNIEDLKQKMAESQKLVMSLEVAVTHRADAAEEALDAYTNLLSTLELMPPLPHPFEDVDLTLELNTASSNPQQILIGPSISKVIKPTLSGIAEQKRAERAGVQNERDRVDNELDQLTLECENAEMEIAQVEKKVVAINDQADDYRDAAQHQASVANAEAARLEKETAAARTAALADGLDVKSRLQGLQFDYREQIEKVSRLKEKTVRAIIKNSHEIAMFKEEVSRHLRELREVADEG